MMENKNQNSPQKQAAVSFLQLASSGKVREAYNAYIASNFQHHNPYFPGNAESLARGMEESAKQFPNKILEVRRVLEDGDLVAVHARVRLEPDAPNFAFALIHIFRFEGGRIAELWEAGQQVPENSPNENGMF